MYNSNKIQQLLRIYMLETLSSTLHILVQYFQFRDMAQKMI